MNWVLLFIISLIDITNAATCWSKALGYDCCNNCNSIYSDVNGDWNVKDGKWCGVPASCKSNATNDACWSKILGYNCCSNCTIIYTDKNGDWGVENNKWCGITENCKINANRNTNTDNNNNNKDIKNNKNNNSTNPVTESKSKSVVTQEPAQPSKKHITLEDILNLSAKKNDLTWSDFKEYYYEDIGSGLYIWEFKIKEGDGYTLWVGGVPPKKPNYIKLFHGINELTYPSIKGIDTKNGIDIRYDDVWEFTNEPQEPFSATPIIGYKLSLGKDFPIEGVKKIELSNGMYNNGTPELLTYDQMEEMITLIKNLKLMKKDDSVHDLEGNYNIIKIIANNGHIVEISEVDSYIIIDNVSYMAEYDAFQELNLFIETILNETSKPLTINVNIKNDSVWCWHEQVNDKPNFKESIIISAFPDITFQWNGLDDDITLEKNGTTLASIKGYPLLNAFFTDLNKDGYSELCTTIAYGSGIVDTHVVVYDIHNDKQYTLWERAENDYELYMENEELMVKKTDYNSIVNFFFENVKTEIGKIEINNNDELIFIPVS